MTSTAGTGERPLRDPVVLFFVGLKFILQIATAGGYGFFRDELYDIACGQHPAWGYVDQPPLIAFAARLSVDIFGLSLYGVRLLPALAGAVLVMVVAILARDLGGGKFAWRFSAFVILPVPMYLVFHHWLTMNAFEPLLWTSVAALAVRMMKRDDPRYWLPIGLLCGIGMENKYTMLLPIGALMAALAAGAGRRFLRTPWFASGLAFGLLLFLPNFLWLCRNDFPFLEFYLNGRASPMQMDRGMLEFIADQAMIMNPLLLPLWGAGLAWGLIPACADRNRSAQASRGPSGFLRNPWRRSLSTRGPWVGRPTGDEQSSAPVGMSRHSLATARFSSVFFLAVFVPLLLLKAKNYYVAPVYPVMAAAGSVAFEVWTARSRTGLRALYAASVATMGLVMAPLVLPVLPVAGFLAYQSALGGLRPIVSERTEQGVMPQFFADELGWREMVRETARVYHGLPDAERMRTAIFANNYGEAAAIDVFGPEYGLPRAIGNHVSYWLWGPRDYDGSTVIVLGSNGEGDRTHFRDVEVAGHVKNPLSRPGEQFDILLCRGLARDLREFWPSIRKWTP